MDNKAMPRKDTKLPPPIGYVRQEDYDALAAEVVRLKVLLDAADAWAEGEPSQPPRVGQAECPLGDDCDLTVAYMAGAIDATRDAAERARAEGFAEAREAAQNVALAKMKEMQERRHKAPIGSHAWVELNARQKDAYEVALGIHALQPKEQP